MVKILTKVPFKSGVNFRVIGDVFEAGANYKIGDLTIPKRWVSTLQDRLKTEDVKDLPLKEALESKELYLRGKLQGDTGIDWFGLVTKEFQELPLGVLEDAASKFASGPASVRYLASRERFVLEHKVAESKTGAGIYLSIDSGDFGVYGGNGQMAVRTALTSYDSFTGPILSTHSLNGNNQRTIHKFTADSIDSAIEATLEGIDSFSEGIEIAKATSYHPTAVQDYVQNLISVNRVPKGIRKHLAPIDKVISAYDLATTIASVGNAYAESTSLRMQQLGGEIIANARVIPYS